MANLLPQSSKHEIHKHYQLRVLALAIASLAFISVATALLLLPTYVEALGEVGALKKQLDTLQSSEDSIEIERAREIIESSQEHVIQLKQIQERRTIAGGIVDIVLSAKPEDVSISRISYQGARVNEEKIVVTGQSKTRTNLKDYVSRMRAYEEVASVEDPFQNYIDVQDLQFTLTIVLATS